jgi:hypothetical protein
MLEDDVRGAITTLISERLVVEQGRLNHLRDDVRPLKSLVRTMQPRGTTSIAFVGADGGNNQLKFDPFYVQLIRVVDSSNNSYVLDVITPQTDTEALSKKHFNDPDSKLGLLMRSLNVNSLWDLSHFIPRPDATERPASWVLSYRELTEWATLYYLIAHKDYGSDTLIVFDGLLRSKSFRGSLFIEMMKKISEKIEHHRKSSKRNIWLVGFSKHSQVLERYRLAMNLERIFEISEPCWCEISRDLEHQVYQFPEYARGMIERSSLDKGEEIAKFVAGKMFLARFGPHLHDPIWPIDIFEPQKDKAAMIMSYLLADAIEGFPIPYYPLCLQKAHENAAIVDFDLNILQDCVVEGIRALLGPEKVILDDYRFQDQDIAQRRY